MDADSYQLLHWLEESTMGLTLTTLNININTEDPFHLNRGENLLAPIVSKYTLRQLHISEHCIVMGRERLLVHKTQWPIDYPLKSLAISYATPHIFCIICNQLPNLQILIVQDFSGPKILEVAEKPADRKPLLRLTSLSLLSINMTDIEELKSLLSLVPNLTQFRINAIQLRLFIGQIPDTITSEGTRSCHRYLFPCVRKFTLVINEKWPIATIQYLQNTVNLTNLETLQFEFSSTCQFETNLDVDMHTLFEHTLNRHSLIINCNQSEQMNLTTYNSICLKLPQSVKYLSAHIIHVEDAQRLLEKAKNLSRVTFQMIPYESSFMDDIKEWLLQAGIYVRLKMERDHISDWIEHDEPDEVHCYPVHLWLEKSIKISS
ncbi:unnamed protein product [Rotaria socialis]|uniref:Uncharacterized protein n=1 Tax=Rotaria socialis TaxID=392032 RepID=A0A821MFE4_9BILA|nr:unnamed protein product [Rotaria socialis]